jgi:hypothetical protein
MNKKGVSEMISYVLLVIIAVSISALVYTYLKNDICVFCPAPECREGTSIIVEDYWCDKTNLKINLTIYNKGLFNVTAVFIRFGKDNQSVKSQLNTGREQFPAQLAPGRSVMLNYSLSNPSISKAIRDMLSSGDNNFEIEIQPAEIQKKVGLVPCKNAITAQNIVCN